MAGDTFREIEPSDSRRAALLWEGNSDVLPEHLVAATVRAALKAAAPTCALSDRRAWLARLLRELPASRRTWPR